MNEEKILEKLKEICVKALGIDREKITMDVSIVNDLGAESLDIVDILFRIEKEFSIKTTMFEIEEFLRGGLPEEEFYDENRIVTKEGMERLQKIFPELTHRMADERFDEEKVFSLFTVSHLVSMISKKIKEKKSES